MPWWPCPGSCDPVRFTHDEWRRIQAEARRQTGKKKPPPTKPHVMKPVREYKCWRCEHRMWIEDGLVRGCKCSECGAVDCWVLREEDR